MNYIHESTHLQLCNAIKILTEVIEDITDKHPVRLTHLQSFEVAKALELRQVALVQLKNSGVTIEIESRKV
jgi:hypothetical protein